MTRLSLLLSLALLVPTPSLAQVDIESLRRESAPAGLSGSLGGDLVVTTGNVDFVEVALAGRLTWLRGSTTTLFIGDGGLGFLGGDRFASSGLLHLRQTYWLHERVAPEWYAQINYDRPQLLDFRSLAGAGVRFGLASGEAGTLGVGVSVMLEHERLDLSPTDPHEDRTETVRNSNFLAARLVAGEAVVVSSTAYVQPALNDVFGDIRVLQSLNVAVSLTDRLALTTTFDLRYDSEPPAQIASLDTRLTTGLTFTF